MMSIKRLVLALLPAVCCMTLDAQEPDSLTVVADEVVVTGSSGRYSMAKVTNTQLISAAELKRAACCNLGESFTTNPSVDVSYNDAATGARQIKLLGLSGSYVQMLTENIPNLRIAAAPYGLGYIAGPWMQSIQVSKGTSSVKNGYESVTGQINIELKKPQLDQEYSANGYVDHMGKVEANADANWHLTESLSTGLLAHFENALENHDENGDGFLDMPRIRQVALMDRWAWLGTDYVFQAAVKYLDEKRTSGQDTHHSGEHLAAPYKIAIDTVNPPMHCENCEAKIKKNIRFEKGIKDVQPSAKDQIVTIKYDPDKTTVDAIIKGFAKIGYEAKVAEGACPKKASGCCGGCCDGKNE